MRAFILLFTVGFLSTLSFAQNDLNTIIEEYMDQVNLDSKKLVKLESIRANTSMDSVNREKKWRKAYQKWDKLDTTASFMTARIILCNIGPNAEGYDMKRDYSGFSNQYLNYLLDYGESTPDKFSKGTIMFLRNVLKRRKDISRELVQKEVETIFGQINRFGSDTPINSNHFAVMTTYLQSEHPESVSIQELIEVLRGYSFEQIETLIQHAEKNGLSLNQLNTVPTMRRYRSELLLGSLFRNDLMKSYELFRHAASAHNYQTADSWPEYKFEMYHQYLDNPDIRNMVVGMTCYKIWLEHEYGKLAASKTGVYVEQIIEERTVTLYDQLQTSQIKQLRLNIPSNRNVNDPFTELLIAADNGVFFLPTDLGPYFTKMIEKLKVDGNFELTKKERTVVDAIGPYRIRYQGERLLKDHRWLKEHAKKPVFRLAIFIKLAQTAMRMEIDWFDQAKKYRQSPFLNMPEPETVAPSEVQLKKKAERLKSIKQSLATGLKNQGVDPGKYVITCEGRRHVEVYPRVEYRVNAWLMGELERLGVESSLSYGLPGYSRFIVYVDEEETEIPEIDEMPILEEIVEDVEYYHPSVAPPPPPSPRRIEVKGEIIEFPDREASFPGGARNFKTWIDENLQYPEISKEMEDEGRVYVSFVVEVDGSITNVKVERGATAELNREAKRLVRSMPKWEPGEARGRKVRTRCRVAIVFSL